LVVIKESTEETTTREAEIALKEGRKHHNFICIGCRKIFPSNRVPLQHCAVWEKVVHSQFANPPFIYDG
jgi:hypothetical protein